MATSTMTDPGFICLIISRLTSFGAAAPGNQYGTDDDIGLDDMLGDGIHGNQDFLVDLGDPDISHPS